MIQLGFTWADARRVIWTFIFAGIGVLVAAGAEWVSTGEMSWKAAAVGAIAAGLSAVKNFFFADGSSLK